MRTKTYLFIMAFFAMLTTIPTLKGQVIVTNILQTYEQDFDSFGTNNVPWTDNSTLLGWYANEFPGPVTNLVPNDGFVALNICNFGTVGEVDRAMGSLEALGNASFYGARFTNNSSFTIQSMTVSYVGEQWMQLGASATNQFFYRVGDTTFETNNIGWTAFSALDFTNLHTGVFLALNGNLVTNQIAIQANIPVVVSNHQEVWIKWFCSSPPGFFINPSLAIDELKVSFTGVPEIAPDNNTLNFDVELRRPKQAKTLKFDGSKGFKASGRIKGTNTISSVSYTAFGGTNISTNSTFIALGKVKLLTKGKLFKKGYIATFKTKGNSNKVGQGIVSDANPVTLIIKVDGTGTSNQVGSFKTNFVFANTKVK